jgi:hypothetical protein
LSASAAGGLGFTSGYEYANGSVPILRTNDLTVGIPNYVPGQPGPGNQFSVGASIGTTVRRFATRSTIPVSVSANGAIWFSFVASLLTANGDVALTFNGAQSSGSANATPGLRIGVGHPTLPGAMGVGPLAGNANLTNINNGVNGAITSTGFVPVDGTPVLILGRITTDSGTGYPKVEVWYNPNATSAANLPAPTLSFVDSSMALVPSTITRVGYQVVRAATSNELIDNAKVSDEANGFDIVYKNAPLPLPTLQASANVTSVAEGTGSNIVFNVISDRPVPGNLTVGYTIGGVATNGWDGAAFMDADYTDPNFNTGSQNSSVTILAGQTNATVTITVIDDNLAEAEESVILTLSPGSEYALATASVTATIGDNNDANVSLQYMFNRNTAAQIWDPNISATALSASRVGGGYSVQPGYFISPEAAVRAQGDATPSNAADALANGNYMTFSVSPVPGRALTLTNLQMEAAYINHLFGEPTAASATIFVRSSVDNFGADLASWNLEPDNIVWQDPWYTLSLPLGSGFQNMPGGVEFRLYIYDDTTVDQVGVRIDNLYVSGSTIPAVGVQQIVLTPTAPEAAEPDIEGNVTITRYGDTTAPLTVNYTVSGTASGGSDYTALSGEAILPANETNVVVTISPLDDFDVEPAETVVITLAGNENYNILGSASATVTISDNGDFGGLVGYGFNEGNNAALSLAAVATGNTLAPDALWVTNATAGPGLGGFGANLAAGVGHGYATSTPHSGISSLFMRADYLGTDAAQALSEGDYVSFAIAPKPGYTLDLTNFLAYLKLTSVNPGGTFLRWSKDNFASDLGSMVLPAAPVSDPYLTFSVPLPDAELQDGVEFRLYFHSSVSNSDILRIDDIALQGSVDSGVTAPHISEITVNGNTVTIKFNGVAQDVPSAYKLFSAGSLTGTFQEDSGAVMSGSGGAFQASTTVNGSARFYKIQR